MDTPAASNTRPSKRARKIVNCDPCRGSKLKCDKGRPCSSCVLRGTVSQCYKGPDAYGSGASHIDPAAEFARVKHSVLLLETHFVRGNRREAPKNSVPPLPSLPRHQTRVQRPHSADTEAPGLYSSQSQTGLYSGPTSVASHLVTQDHSRSQTPSEKPKALDLLSDRDYDRDLIDLLPPFYAIDGLIDYYFEYCTWIYWMVDQPAFLAAWKKFKSGDFPDRLVLATVSLILALSLRYLPLGHDLLSHLPCQLSSEDHCQELSVKYYTIGSKVLKRHEDGSNVYTIELVEALLAKCHYYVVVAEPERTWSIRGKLMTIATAMGLHRDPDNSLFLRDAAERRRWAWWQIVFIDRAQSFMFGRPFSIASHHFNTQLPSYCDPNLDESGQLYLFHIAIFRLMFILGELMDYAVSLRPVAYEDFRIKDRLLEQWIGELPSELQLDDFRVAQGLASPIVSIRRLAVQSVIVRVAFHHIRLTIHRPFSRTGDISMVPQSLDIAVASAGKVISLTSLTIPDTSPARFIPSHSPIFGHMAWRPYHVFAAAMFFTFQLIQNPEQPASKMFKNYIAKSLTILEHSPNSSPAQSSLTVLRTLAPLYSDQYIALRPRDKEKDKGAVLAKVKTLAFPHQDPPLNTVKIEDSSSSILDGVGGDPKDLSSLAPEGHFSSDLIPHKSEHISIAPMMQEYPINLPPIGEPPSYYSTMASQYPHNHPFHQSNVPVSYQDSYTNYHGHNNNQQRQESHQNQVLHAHSSNLAMGSSAEAYTPVADDWRGPVGFGQGEWMHFIGALAGVGEPGPS